MANRTTATPADILKKLVQFDTSNPPGNELTALAYLQKIIQQRGIDCTIQQTAPGRGNLVALLPATLALPGSENLVLLSHIDVVGADAEQWTYPPFEAQEHDGYIYGRGTVDTKQLTAMQLIAFLTLGASGKTRRRDVWLVVTADEENGSHFGLLPLLEAELNLGGKIYYGQQIFEGSRVISEGGGFPIIVNDETVYLCESGQKGIAQITLTARAHNHKGPFLPSSDGFVRALAAVEELCALRPAPRFLPEVETFLSGLCRIAGLDAGLSPAAAVDALAAYVSPFMHNILRAMTMDTIAVTEITGHGLNETNITLDCRLLPGSGIADLETLLAPIVEKYGLEIRVESFSPGYASQIEGEFYTHLCRATAAGLDKPVTVLPFFSIGSSDGRHLAPLGASVYGYSPVLAADMTFDTAVTMVHGVDERIHKDSVLLGSRVLAALTSSFAAGI